MGVVPKGHSSDRFRLITDLSFPKGASVNNKISALFPQMYLHGEVAAMAQRLGQGTLLVKLDIRSAYRLVPVNLTDRPLLGVEWRGSSSWMGLSPLRLADSRTLGMYCTVGSNSGVNKHSTSIHNKE